MKIKKFEKRLAINKSTVAHLDGMEMNGLKGGFGPTDGPICNDPTRFVCYTQVLSICAAAC